MTAARAIAVACLLSALVLPALAEGDSAERRGARAVCRERAPVLARLVHRKWELGSLDTMSAADDIGAGITVLLSMIRKDPAFSGMGLDEFVSLAIRICDPVYEAYFSHRSRAK